MLRMRKMVRFKAFKISLLGTIVLMCLSSVLAADEQKLSKTQIAKRERDFERIVNVLSTIIDILTGSGRLLPSSSSSPPSPSQSPNPSPSPSPSQTLPSPSQTLPSPSQTLPSPSQTLPSPSQTPPSPSQTPPSPSQTLPSPSQIRPSPSRIPPKSPAPSKTPSVTHSSSSSPSPRPTRDQKPPSENLIAPDKPGSTKIPSVPYAIFNHDAPNGKAESAVILLHGLGGQAEDMVSIMSAIQEGMFPNTRFVIPEANEIYVSKSEFKTNGWFSAPDSAMDGSVGRDSQLGVANYMDKIGDHLAKQGIDIGKIVIIGYSQGSTVAITTYLRHRWGGMIGIAGFLSLADSYPAEMTDDSQLAPGVIVAGAQDKFVPVDVMRTTAAKLEELGRDVSYVEIAEAGHELISSERIAALAIGLLNRVIATDEEAVLE